jgi:GNAT superfamily N-acetyltransferase
MALIEQFRYAEASEVHELEDLQRRASLVWEEYRADLIAHPEAIAIPADTIEGRSVRVAIGSGRLLGFAVVAPLGNGRSQLDGLFVEPDVMGRGLGRALVADAVTIARHRGVKRLEVTANPRAVGFYEKVGFVADGEVTTQFGPALRMSLAVTSG